MYARMEEADALIESLMQDKDPNLRQSGMYTVAMAYCGTGNNRAIKRLLHVAVSYDNKIHWLVTQHRQTTVTQSFSCCLTTVSCNKTSHEMRPQYFRAVFKLVSFLLL